METGDEAEGTPGCLREGMMEKSAVGEHARENHHPIDWEDHSAGPWQRTGAVGEGGPAHPDEVKTLASYFPSSSWYVPVNLFIYTEAN